MYCKKLKGIMKQTSALLIITTSERAENAVLGLQAHCAKQGILLAGICLLDADLAGEYVHGIPVVASKEDVIDYARHRWVDEVIFEIGHNLNPQDTALLVQFLRMGITTHLNMYNMEQTYPWDHSVEVVGPYMVLTSSMKMITVAERVIKRSIDILGGLVGSVILLILVILIGPLIYLQSPGNIFFTQDRIGMNGRHFKMYKFRSMVKNAEALKKNYMDQNRIEGGVMFKLDWDPRVIGNVELPDGRRKTGIGDFIRRTSIDEFPQFINVLKGDMSLVGTRPPTVDEWDRYELHHRLRMAVRPGITGMWQVNGRSNITDFEEIVRMDTEYIARWSLGLDLKILIRTILVVLKRHGSM